MRLAICSAAVLLVAATSLMGCARSARDTTGFAMVDQATVNAPFEDVWQSLKTLLREREMDIYTRDKRGVFVAYGDEQKNLFIFPERVQYTFTLESASANATQISVETLKQVYGSTPLTYPGWHDRQTSDNSTTLAILEDIQARFQ